MNILNIENVSKIYGDKILFDEVSLGIGEGEKIGVYIEPDAIHIMKKSEYSGKFGDYSTYSDEIDELDVLPDEEAEE